MHAGQVLAVWPGNGTPDLVGLASGHDDPVHTQLSELFPPEITPPPSSSGWP